MQTRHLFHRWVLPLGLRLSETQCANKSCVSFGVQWRKLQRFTRTRAFEPTRFQPESEACPYERYIHFRHLNPGTPYRAVRIDNNGAEKQMCLFSVCMMTACVFLLVSEPVFWRSGVWQKPTQCALWREPASPSGRKCQTVSVVLNVFNACKSPFETSVLTDNSNRCLIWASARKRTCESET